MQASTYPLNLQRYQQGFNAAEDQVSVEEPLAIRLDYRAHGQRHETELVITMRTPGHDAELAVGWLYAEGLIQSEHQIQQIQPCGPLQNEKGLQNVIRVCLDDDVIVDLSTLKRNTVMYSGCGVCGKASLEQLQVQLTHQLADHSQPTAFVITADALLHLPEQLHYHQQQFQQTGGLHAAGLFNHQGRLWQVYEDVGRHNALDKLIGHTLLNNEPCIQHGLLLSGRVSFELMQKACQAGIGLVCAVGAPSSLAVQMAQRFEVTLVGFLKAQSFNLYHQGQVIINS